MGKGLLIIRNSVFFFKFEGFENVGVCVGFSVDEKYFDNEVFKK